MSKYIELKAEALELESEGEGEGELQSPKTPRETKVPIKIK